MESLRVDIKQLSNLATGMAHTSDQLLYKLGPNLAPAQIGHQKVAVSVNQFYTNWDYRRQALAGALSKLSTMVLAAAGMYKATEDAIFAAANQKWPSEARPVAPSGGARGPSSGGGHGGGSASGQPAASGARSTSAASPYAKRDAEWDAMSDAERRRFLEEHDLERIGNDDNNPPHMRYAANLVRVREQIAYLQSKDDLTPAEASRLASYLKLVSTVPPKQILFFDPAGDGKIGVVEGDLSNATNIAVKVPGISNTLDNIAGPIGEGARLYAKTGHGTAVVTWLGYDTPVGVSLSQIPQGLAQIPSDEMARKAAPDLCNFINGLNRGVGNTATVTVIGHSYGSLVVGLAAKQGLAVDNVVFIGSPGVGVKSVDEFHLRPGAHVYAAAPGAAVNIGGVGVGGDYVSNIGHNAHPFGGVPTERGFGAEVLDIGNRGKAWESHDDYYGDGSRSLGNLASIVNGNGPL